MRREYISKILAIDFLHPLFFSSSVGTNASLSTFTVSFILIQATVNEQILVKISVSEAGFTFVFRDSM
jgi:hypothetical protein